MNDNQSTITIVIDKDLKRKIRMIVAHDGRTINNWFGHRLGKTLEMIVEGEYSKINASFEKKPQIPDAVA